MPRLQRDHNYSYIHSKSSGERFGARAQKEWGMGEEQQVKARRSRLDCEIIDQLITVTPRRIVMAEARPLLPYQVYTRTLVKL